MNTKKIESIGETDKEILDHVDKKFINPHHVEQRKILQDEYAKYLDLAKRYAFGARPEIIGELMASFITIEAQYMEIKQLKKELAALKNLPNS